jgi:hypothetical protein
VDSDTTPALPIRHMEAVSRSVKTRRGEKQNGPGAICRSRHMTYDCSPPSGRTAAIAGHTLLQVATIDQIRLGLAFNHGIVDHDLADVFQRRQFVHRIE